MKFVCVFFLLITIQSCAKRDNMIAIKDLKSIDVEIVSQSTNTIRREIVDKRYITSIVKELNRSEREPNKFYPTHRLKLNYNNGEEKLIFCNGTSMKFDGLTYKLKKSIEKILIHEFQ